MRKPLTENIIYDAVAQKVTMKGTEASINDAFGAPAFLAIRQRQYNGSTSVKISLKNGTAGLAVYMDENYHYDMFLRKTENGTELVKRFVIGPAKAEDTVIPMGDLSEATVTVGIGRKSYSFSAVIDGKKIDMGEAINWPLSTESAGGFVGILFALFAEPESEAVFTEFASDQTLK